MPVMLAAMSEHRNDGRDPLDRHELFVADLQS